jgi:hypothetical protein
MFYKKQNYYNIIQGKRMKTLFHPRGLSSFYYFSYKQYIPLLYFSLKPGVQFNMQDTA